MKIREISGYILSIRFIMPTVAFSIFGRLNWVNLVSGLITLFGAWLVLKDFNLKSLVKYIVVISIFGAIRYFLLIYIVAIFLLYPGTGSP
jgi:hypothetical protein